MFGGDFKKEVQKKVFEGGKVKIKTEAVIEKREGLFSQIGSALSEALFGKEGKGGMLESISNGLANTLQAVPWESIGEKITNGISMAGAALSKIADAIARGLKKPFAMMMGADFAAREKIFEAKSKEAYNALTNEADKKNFLKEKEKRKREDADAYADRVLGSGLNNLVLRIAGNEEKAKEVERGHLHFGSLEASSAVKEREKRLKNEGINQALQDQLKDGFVGPPSLQRAEKAYQEKLDKKKKEYTVFEDKSHKTQKLALDSQHKIINDAIAKYMNEQKEIAPGFAYHYDSTEQLKKDVFAGDLKGFDHSYESFAPYLYNAMGVAQDLKENMEMARNYTKQQMTFTGQSAEGRLDRFLRRFDQDGSGTVTNHEIESVLKLVRDDVTKSSANKKEELNSLKSLVEEAMAAQKEFNPTMDVTLQIDGKTITQIVTDYQSQIASDPSRNTGNAVPSVNLGRSQLEQSSN